MAEHMIETRILLRYDTYSNWMNSTTILKVGEAAIAAFPQNRIIESLSNDRPENTPPAIGIKIGDGIHYFRELPWVQGIAADVYSWAKQQTKPSYSASEISGLTSLIQQYIDQSGSGSGSGTIVAKNYRLIKGTDSNENKYFLQSKSAEDDDWITDEINFIDLTDLANILSWLGSNLDDYWTIGGYTNQKITDKLNTLNYSDEQEMGKVVTAVNQINGQIEVTKKTLSTNDLSGILNVNHGGTGRDTLTADAVLVGNGTNAVKLIEIDTELTNNTNFATNRAIKKYIDDATAGLTGAMHYIGDATVEIRNNSTVNPQINGYNFQNVQYGDVITYEHKEFVWEGNWRLLGDEGSYAIKGSITNADIAEDAEIDQSKIAGLINDLLNKVDIEIGKGLSSNDYTTEEKQKLEYIEENAQRNIIEHIYVNGTEVLPSIIENNPNSISFRVSALTPEEEEKISGIEAKAQVNKIEHIFLNNTELNIGIVKDLPKSVNITLNEFTNEEKEKLAEIEPLAQVNKIESIIINDTTYLPDSDKAISITIDEAALNLQVIKGARVPGAESYENVDVTPEKELILSRIAKTGDINDILQNSNSYVILDCGSSTEVL